MYALSTAAELHQGSSVWLSLISQVFASPLTTVLIAGVMLGDIIFHLFQKNFCPLGVSFWCSCWSYPCQKRSDWYIQQINLFMDCLQLCFISTGIRDLQIGRKTKIILSLEHNRKTAPAVSIHAWGCVGDGDKNQQSEENSEKPFSERPFQQRSTGTFLPVHWKVG